MKQRNYQDLTIEIDEEKLRAYLKRSLNECIKVEAKPTPRFYVSNVSDIRRHLLRDVYQDVLYGPIAVTNKGEEVTLTIKLISSGNTTSMSYGDIKRWIEEKLNE